MRTRLGLNLIIAIAICVMGLNDATEAQNLRKISISEPGKLFLYIPLYYAIDRGYFAKEGLEVEMITAGRRDLAMKAVIAGEAFASVHDPVEAALARSRGAKVKIVAPVVIAPANWLVGDQDISQDPKSWRGKVIALSTPPNTQYSIFMKELHETGWSQVDPTTYRLGADSDPANYLRILLGAFGADLSLVMTGRANMAVMLEPGVSTVEQKAGKHIIKDYPAILGPFLFSSINVAEETVQGDHETVQKMVTALGSAFRYAYAHPEDLAQVAMKRFPDIDPKIVESGVGRMIKAKSFTTDVKFTKASYEKNMEYLAIGQPDSPALKVKWEDIADTSFGDNASRQ
jgi:NitT/TauT family transport system substrate-binding protein